MKVALYLPTRHLGKWSWLAFTSGELATSGTDGQLLGLAARLLLRSDVETLPLFAPPPDDAPSKSRAVGGLCEAVELARQGGADALIFNDRNDDETRRGIEACTECGVAAVVWAQNGPFGTLRNLLSSSPAVRRVVCVSHPHADSLRHESVFDKIAVVHNCLLHPPETLPDGPRAGVCFLGATVHEKGFHHLVRAWPVVRAAVPAATLSVFGSSRLYDRAALLGPLGFGSPDFEREHVTPFWGSDPERLQAELGVHAEGLTSPARLPALLARHVVAVVNPWASRGGSVETFCVSAVEAQAAGCAVIGGRRLGLTETVRHGVTGRLLRSERELAPLLIDLLRHPGRAAAMGRSGREWVTSRFSTQTIDARWMELLGDVAAGQRHRPPRLAWRRISTRTAARQLLRLARQLGLASPG